MPKQKIVNIGGKEYVLQHPGVKWYLECTDRCKNRNGVMLTAKYTEEMLENVVVDPKVTLDDFEDDVAAVEQLLAEIEKFFRGK